MTTQKIIDIANNQFIPTVILTDASGIPYVAGGPGGGTLSDSLLTDDSNTQFLVRDNGTAVSYITLLGVSYTPSTNVRAIAGTAPIGGATSANQTTEISKLTSIIANQPALNADSGANAHITNFPTTQPVSISSTVNTVSINPATVFTGQVKIVTTGTAVQLPAAVLINGLSVMSLISNSTLKQTMGGTGISNVVDGTGNGIIRQPGEGWGFGVPNANYIWVNGQAGDIFTYGGN